MNIHYTLPLFLICSYLHTEEIAERKHIINRIEKHVAYMYTIIAYDRMAPLSMVTTEGEDTFNFLCQELTHYTHGAIVQCIKDIQKTKSLRPFFLMWRRFTVQYQDDTPTDNEPLFLKECSILIFTFYNNILHEADQGEDRNRVTITEIIELYEAINALPITKLLDLLDQMMDEITNILGAYPLQQNQSIFGWLQQNWWIPSIVVGALLINVYSA
jgi:hypothetical protein